MKGRWVVGLSLLMLLLLPVVGQAEEPVGEQAVEEADDAGVASAFKFVGGKSYGTNIGMLRHASFSYGIINSDGLPGIRGFHYAERGGWLGQLIIAAAVGAANQDHANTQNRSVTYDVPSDTTGRLGFSMDYLLSAPNEYGFREPYFRAILDYMFALYADQGMPVAKGLPFTLAPGIGYVARGITQSTIISKEWQGSGFGVTLNMAYPITQWAQIDAGLFAAFSGDAGHDARVGGTLHLGNRFLLAGGVSYSTDDSTDVEVVTDFRGGFRL
ncbi:MAG: hypothetical protein H0U74_16395 [Bradymonadaceae bacterium]|nr:hypothetical protein [Lujinxingiaceae bacterium]